MRGERGRIVAREFRRSAGNGAGRVAVGGGGRDNVLVRAVRQAVGMPALEFARRMGVQEREVYRMERAGAKSLIKLKSLRRAAEALDCELIYAIAPRKGTLGEMAEGHRAEREKVVDIRRTKRDDKREIEGRPRLWETPEEHAIKELLRLAGI